MLAGQTGHSESALSGRCWANGVDPVRTWAASRRPRGDEAIYTIAPNLGVQRFAVPTIGNRNSAIRRRGAPARYRENSACSRRGLTAQSFSAPSDLARLLPRRRESATRFQLSSSRCALLREALLWHRQERSSST